MEMAQTPEDNQENFRNNVIMQDQKNAFIKMYFTPNRDQEIKINMKQNAIWKGFPLSDRFLYSLFCGSKYLTDNKSSQFLIDEMLINKCIFDERIDLYNKYISLKILKTGTFDIEPCIIHPFVRVSIVNLRTGKYLQKTDFDIPAILPLEKNLVVSHNSAQNILEFRESQLDFLPPIATKPCDLRIKGESFAEWNEELIINDSAENIFQSDNIIFFEILDFNLFPNVYSSMREFSTEEFIFPISWGYLKPVGFSQTYLGKYKIQLYKYKYKRTDIMKKLKITNPLFLRIPDVLLEFNWFKKEKYQTYLEVEINIEFRPSEEDLMKEFYIRKYSNSVFIAENENVGKLGELEKENLIGKTKSKYDEVDAKNKEKRLILAKRKRFHGEDCILPDKLLFKFETAKLGSLTQEFSPSGKYLAVSCTEESSLTTIKVFNVEEGKLSFHLRGHLNLIHCFVWSLDNTILVSGGSDNNVIIWQIPQDDSNNSDNFDYLDNEKVFKLSNIIHPSYIYCVSILQEESKDMIIIATGCFDGMVRIYTINFILEGTNESQNLENKSLIRESNRSPKAMFSSGSNFFRSLSNNKNYIPKKTFAKYLMVSQIAINEEFLHQDFLSTSKTNWNMGGAPLSQTQFYTAEKEKERQKYKFGKNDVNAQSRNNFKSTVKSFLNFDKRTEEYLKKMNIKKEDFENLNDQEKNNLLEKTVLDHRHPNSLFFDELGKLYIGDSLGAVHIWEFRIINAKAICNKIRIVTHKEIDGDDINKVYIEPGPKRRLVVHSRDNCIRLMDISKEKPKIIVRFYGLKCSKMNIKSTISPDGHFILSGSEDGKPYIWSLFSGTPISNSKYECEFVDPIIDVAWNNSYNMISITGFGHNYPVLVYVHERQESSLDHIEYKFKGEDEILMKKSDEAKEKEKIVSAYKDNFSDFTKEYKAAIEPQIK